MTHTTLTFDTLTLTVRPDAEHGWLMPTPDVAHGYGVAPETIRSHKSAHRDELLPGEHFATVENPNGGAAQTLWTRKGVLRLGFFIHSERARLFRDFAEAVVLDALQAPRQPDFTLNMLESLTRMRREQLAQAETLEQMNGKLHRLREDVLTLHDAVDGLEPGHGVRIIDPHQAFEIKQLIHRLAHEKYPHDKGRFQKTYHLFYTRFRITRYQDLPAVLFEETVGFLEHQIASYLPTPTSPVPQAVSGLS